MHCDVVCPKPDGPIIDIDYMLVLLDLLEQATGKNQ